MNLTGYHGTHYYNIDSILDNGYYLSGEEEWFGEGVYFFESIDKMCDGAEEGKCWAKFVMRFKKWVVFKVKITGSIFIDLVENIEHRKMYDLIRDEAMKVHIESGKDISDFEERTIYENIEKKTSNLDFLRVLVNADGYRGYYSYTTRRPQIQICVKKRECICDNVVYCTYKD